MISSLAFAGLACSRPCVARIASQLTPDPEADETGDAEVVPLDRLYHALLLLA